MCRNLLLGAGNRREMETGVLQQHRMGRILYGSFLRGTSYRSPRPFRDGNGAVSEIAADNAADEWFDLQGRKVIHPERGVYIRKQGADTQKVVLR